MSDGQGSVAASGTVGLRQCYTGPSYKESDSIDEIEVETEVLRRARARHLGLFLKGPIPMLRIARADKLGAHALLLLLAIHHRVDVTRSPTVTLPRGLMADLGVDKFVKSRVLRALERDGMIRVERAKGRSARVTLLP
jgi:hypothetical protein